MNIVVWIVSGLLAAAYLFAGTNKATRPKDKLVDNLPWAEDFSPATIKFIGIMEILGAIGLILPWLTGIAAFLTRWPPPDWSSSSCSPSSSTYAAAKRRSYR